MSKQNTLEDYWELVDKRGPDDCWNWLGGTKHGYGLFRIGWQQKRAHKIAYEESHGRIPAGDDAHHTCENRLCCNPAHLERIEHGKHQKLHRNLAKFWLKPK